MTTDLTREQIERMMAMAQFAVKQKLDESQSTIEPSKMVALCRLALQAPQFQPAPPSDVVEKVAMAICDAQGDPCWHEPFATAGRAISMNVARAAIGALKSFEPNPARELIEKHLITIEAHCTVIANPAPNDDVEFIAQCIKNNVADIRAALTEAEAWLANHKGE